MASAIRLAEKGFKIELLNRPGGELEAAVAKVQAAGREAISIEADIAVEEEVKQAVQTVMDQWGRLDVLVILVSQTCNRASQTAWWQHHHY
ncbi:NAD(P)-dependent dehydrogenase (short-subunit alcohol dehydrogenase family) [Paenibacillus sp. V4I3]|nr:SDR family NAD(P)-dependent oxidoreductase [Paenibacillus sp. V4I3]MDQ0878197.1 NAD(P)-dependent dehydrogenase (short-subunit alcohol dehydrogenase family) [Paenibacillus sp. V4I3]